MRKKIKLSKENMMNPPGIDRHAWNTYIDYRRDIGIPITRQAASRAANVLRVLNCAEQRKIVEYSMAKGCVALYPYPENQA